MIPEISIQKLSTSISIRQALFPKKSVVGMNLINDRGPKKEYHQLLSSLHGKDAKHVSIKFARITQDQIVQDLKESLEEQQRLQERINRRLLKR